MTLSFVVAHHLKLVFLPAENGFFDQALVNGREIEAAGEYLHQFFAVVSNAAAGTAERKRGADDDRESNLAGKVEPVFEVVDQSGFRNVEADALHRVFEEQAVFSLLDGRELRANEVHVVLVENAAVGEFDGKVERGLSANGGEHGETRRSATSALDADNLFEIFVSEWLDVGAVGEIRIGHDRRRVRVRQHNFVALSLERLAGLRAGVVELRGLANDDRSGADDQNFRDVILRLGISSALYGSRPTNFRSYFEEARLHLCSVTNQSTL